MNIAIYSRVSTQEQARDGYSIGEQIERMEKYCDAMKWTVFDRYTDAGFSGGNTDRPALKKMLKDIKAGNIDKVLVYKLDRLSRSQKDTLDLIEDSFLAHDVDFISMTENFDTSTPFGRAMIGILSVFAQLEREQIKERMIMGLEARAKQGLFHGSNVIPIGYDYTDGHLIINEFEAMQIRQIFEDYASGLSPYAIADKLNEAGLCHKYGKWRSHTIRDILSKKTYIGFIKYREQWHVGEHDPIIEEDLFDRVQELRQKKSEEHMIFNRRSGKATSYLGGLLECGCCGAKYSKSSQRSNWNGVQYKYEYYACNSRQKKMPYLVKDPNCQNKIWRMNDLDSLVFDEIRKLATDPSRIVSEPQEDERPSVIRSKLDNLDDQMNRLMDLYAFKEIPIDLLRKRLDEMKDQRERLEAELERLEKGKKISLADSIESAKGFDSVLEYGSFDEIRAVLGDLIEKIVIDGEDVTIYWNFL